MKKSISILFLIALLTLLYFKLPISIRYKSEIKIGNDYIHTIEIYSDSIKSLPESNNWQVLQTLIPQKMENEWSPEYKKIDSTHFDLVYPYGFDGPYLRYCSSTQQWNYGFCCSG